MNLILQHWDGEPTEVERRSWMSIAAYADRIGAEHRVLSGTPLGEVSYPHMHKLHLFAEEFDVYDAVVMMDSDMFAAQNAGSIFDVPGIGICGPLQEVLRKNVRARVPAYFVDAGSADYYGGAVYKFDRAQRLAFRRHLTSDVVAAFDSYEYGCDEGAIHYLATMTATVGHALPDGEAWACSSFAKDVSRAHLIHIRRRVADGKDQKRPKTENLQKLVDAGLLAA